MYPKQAVDDYLKKVVITINISYIEVQIDRNEALVRQAKISEK